ncbi:MAG: Ca-activated chloride channel family protein [Myxococcota bacterium]
MSRFSRNLSITAVPAVALIGLAVMKTPSAPVDYVLAPVYTPAPSVVSSAESGELVATASLDRGAVLREDGTLRVEVTVRSTHEPGAGLRTPTDLVVVLDRSGSMQGDKIADARHAAIELLGHLDEQDRFSLVTYAGDAKVKIPLAPATVGNKALWERQISWVLAGGGTEMQAGLAAGQESLVSTAGRAQRMILISDGLPNSRGGLIEQAAGLGRSEVPLSTVGIGLDYDEQLMSSMADAGTGNFYWVQGSDDMAATFAEEFETARETVASGLAVRFAPGGLVSLTEAAGYTLAAEGGGGASFAVGSVFAEQERTFWLTLDVGEQAPLGALDPGSLELSWRDLSGELSTVTVDLPELVVTDDALVYQAAFDAERWGRGVVDEEYNRMRAEVSARVQAGDRDAAIAMIDGYYDDNTMLNASLGNDQVSANLVEVQQLRVEVADNFVGANQRQRQNFWAKSTNESAYGSRKVGQYRGSR